MPGEWGQIAQLMAALEDYTPGQARYYSSKDLDGIITCSDAVDYLKSLSSNSIDLIFTDDPYGIKPTALSYSRAEGFHEHVNVEWDNGFPAHLTIPWVLEAARTLRPGGMLVNSGIPEWGTIFKEVVRMAGLTFKGTIAWLKPGGIQMRKVNYKSSFEVIWWASKGPVSDSFSFQEQMEMRNWVMETVCPKCKVSHPVVLSNTYVRAGWMEEVPEWPPFMFGVNDKGTRVNKTQKPEWLARKLLTIHSRKGDLVVDPFCGSGTYLAVAHQMGRRVAGCDIREDQVNSTRDRIESQTLSLV